jgi:hypothetical protein
MEIMPARHSLAYAGACFAIGFFVTGIWPESDLANALGVALLIGMLLFLVLAAVDMVRQRRDPR